MTERVLQQKKVFKALPKNALFLEWLATEPRVIRLEVHALVMPWCTCTSAVKKLCIFAVYLLN